jgi:hypothetical protein
LDAEAINPDLSLNWPYFLLFLCFFLVFPLFYFGIFNFTIIFISTHTPSTYSPFSYATIYYPPNYVLGHLLSILSPWHHLPLPVTPLPLPPPHLWPAD